MLTKYATFEDILSASIYKVGDVTKVAHLADFDHVERKEGFLYVRSRAISSRTNDNYDMFPAEEIKLAYKTFEGKPVFVNHHNSDHKRMRGVILAAALHEDVNPDGTPDTWVEVLMEVDAIKFPLLAQAIIKGEINRTSMGTDVVASTCTYCGNRAETPLQYCGHIRAQKGQKLPVKKADGSTEMVLVAERCEGLAFFENSLLVEEPADPTAFVLGVEDGKLGKVAKVGFGETRAPAAVDTLADERCPICGSDFDGERCFVCQYIRPPEEFLDPDLNKARDVDMRQEDEAVEEAVTLADEVGHGNEVIDENGPGHTTDVADMTPDLTGVPEEGIDAVPGDDPLAPGDPNAPVDPNDPLAGAEPGLEEQPPEGEGVNINELNDVALENGDPMAQQDIDPMTGEPVEEELGPDGEPLENPEGEPGEAEPIEDVPSEVPGEQVESVDPLAEDVPAQPGEEAVPEATPDLPAEDGPPGAEEGANSGTLPEEEVIADPVEPEATEETPAEVPTDDAADAPEEEPAEDVGEPLGDDELFAEDEDIEEEPAAEQPPAEGTPEAEEPVEPFDDPESTEGEEPDVPAPAEEGEEEAVVEEGTDDPSEDGEPTQDDNAENKNSSDNPFATEEGDSSSDTVEGGETPTQSVDIQFDSGEQEVLESDFETLVGGDVSEEPSDDDDDDNPVTGEEMPDKKVAQRRAAQPSTQRGARTSPVARVVRVQAKRINELETALSTLARAAGLSKHPAFQAIVKRAEDIENPAQPEGFALEDGGEDAPVVTSEEALGFSNESEVSLPDDVEAIGDTSESDVAPDATTSLAKRRAQARARAIAKARRQKRAETVLDEPLDLNEEDVTEQVAGTDDLGEGPAGEAGSGRTEIDPVAETGDNTSTMFDIAEGGWTEVEAAAKRGEARTYAALRLAKLRLQAGIAQGEDLVLANELVTSRMTQQQMVAEANTLAQVVKVQGRPGRSADVARTRTPRMSSRRTSPAFASEPSPIQVTAVQDDEWLFD